MKLRFAPSPTGFLHVGGARTAIFNLLHARRYGGTLLLRIEDTDVERSRQHHAEQIVNSLQWLGVEWDEGPYYQSDRLAQYRDAAERLVETGLAYRCYCSVEALDRERDEAEKAGRAYRYSGKCRLAAEEGAVPAGDTYVIRFKVPPGPIEFDDLIRGHVHFDGELIDDFVLLRSDGNPTYHLSVVVDDVDMGITLVARGDDHLSNTPKHVLLFRALGSDPPSFAHLPLILGSDKKRLSKRTGATSCEEYRDMGILPAALFNFLVLLGWAPGADREILSREEAIEIFDLSDVNKAPAVFDPEKLLWLNGQYMSRLSTEELLPHLERFLTIEIDSRERLSAAVAVNKTRARTLKDLADHLVPYFSDDESITYEQEAIDKHLRGADLQQRMIDLRATFASLDDFDLATTEKALRTLGESKATGAGKYIHPLRVAVLGRLNSPPIFDVIAVLGKDRTLRRLDRLIAQLPLE